MRNGNPNPFASPEAESAQPASEVPDLVGRMPQSVKAAVFCTLIWVLLNGGFLLLASIGGGVSTFEALMLLTPFLLGVLILIGLYHKNRLARQWGRISSMIGGVLATVILLFTLGAFVFMFASGSGGLFDPAIGENPMGGAEVIFIVAIGCFFYAIPAALSWTTFFSLGRPTARAYFGLYCPECQSRRTKSADFLYRKVRCKACGHIWS